jgi:hypothetical protein
MSLSEDYNVGMRTWCKPGNKQPICRLCGGDTGNDSGPPLWFTRSSEVLEPRRPLDAISVCTQLSRLAPVPETETPASIFKFKEQLTVSIES